MRVPRLDWLVWVLTSLLMGGCATITTPIRQWVDFYRPHEVRTLNYGAMSYLEILNAEAKEKYYRRPQHRRILFYGRVSESDKQAGIKVVIPF